MIQKNKIKDLVVFTDENNSKYLNVLNDFLSYDINIIKVFRSIDDTKVMLIDTDYGKLILKVFSPKVKRNERFGNDSNLLIVFYVQIMPDDFVMQLHR
ncbi:lipopolysaccharide core heptose(II) kinase RfaY, partial [Escherichia coli]